MRIQEIMTRNPICSIPEDNLQDAAYLMQKHGVGALPVVRAQTTKKLIGIITDRDLCLAVLPKNLQADRLTVASVMSRRPVTCTPYDRATHCAELMETYRVRRIPVVDEEGACIGIVSLADIAPYVNPEIVPQTSRLGPGIESMLPGVCELE
jgi:CBS domain-containing protein